MRKIIHIDMDAFFAAVEQRDNPGLRGRSVVVGAQPGVRGVVAAASYEARRFGVRSAMPSRQAYKLCPQAIFVRPHFDRYKLISRQIHAIFHDFTHCIEPLSLDEAYLDVTGTLHCEGSATLIADAIRQRILDETGLTASAGVSYNKFIAKVASGINKPNGMCVVPPEHGEQFVAQLSIGRFYGVGKCTQAKMHRLGIYNGRDLRNCSLAFLQRHFGKSGGYYYSVARGVDERPLRTHRRRQSIGSETTFQQDTVNRQEMLNVLSARLDKVWSAMQDAGLSARTLTVKVRYSDFKQVTRAHSFAGSVSDKVIFKNCLPVLLDRTEASRRPVRLLGMSCSGFSENTDAECTVQTGLFSDSPPGGGV